MRIALPILRLAILLAVSGCASLQTVARVPLVPGMTVTDSFAADDTAAHEWTLRVRQPGLVTIRVESAEFNPTLTFSRFGERGWQEEGGPALQDSGFAQVLRFPAPDGRYAIRVGRGSGRGGAYRLRVSEGAPLAALRSGEAVTGALDGLDAATRESPAYQYYYYEDWSVENTSSQPIVVRAHSPDFAVRVMIGTRDGDVFRQTAIARADEPGEDALLTFSPDPGRRYVVRIGGHDGGGLAGYGSYTLAIGAETAATLRADAGARGRLQPVMEYENWLLRPSAAGTLTVSIDPMAGAPILEVAEAEGELRTLGRREGAAHARTELRVPVEAGRAYQVRVRGSGSGPYTLRVSAAAG